MAKKLKKETKKQLLKSVKVDIRKRLEDALADFKTRLGEKKFRKRLRKASAIFSDGIVPAKEVKAPAKSPKKKIKEEVKPEEATETVA
jgi:hypothetical protein